MAKGFFDRLNRLPVARQDERYPEILKPGAVTIDNRNLGELAETLFQYGQFTKFYNQNNEVDGNWSRLFDHSELLTLVRASAFSFRSWRQLFYGNNNASNQSQVALRLISEISQWQSNSEQFHSESALRLKIAINDLVTAKSVVILTAFGIDSANLHISWRTNPTRSASQKSRQQQAQARQLAFEQILRIRLFLAQQAAKIIASEQLLENHDPAAGLLYGFLAVYRQCQKRLNQFPSKLLNFYYRDLLGIPESRLVPNRQLLLCKLAKGTGSVFATKGQALAAQTAEKESLSYFVKYNAIITGTQIQGLKTLFLQRNSYVYPENAAHAVTRVKYNDLIDNLQQPQSLFGFDGSRGHSFNESSTPVGLVIGSSLLNLAEGNRRIQLTLAMIDSGQTKFEYYYNSEEIKSNQCSGHCPSDCNKVEGVHGLEDLPNEQWPIARALYLSLPSRIATLSESVQLIKAFLSENLNPITSNLVKEFLVFSYFNCRDIELLGLVHRQLLSKIILIPNYLPRSRRQSLKESLGRFTTNDDNEITLAELKKDLSRSARSLLIHYFKKAFTLNLTTTDGWHRIDSYQINRLDQKPGITIVCELDTKVAAIVPYLNKVHGNENFTKPLLRLEMSPNADVCPYSYLRPMLVDQTNLRVSATGITGLITHNDYGQVDASKPFQPFTISPLSGAKFTLGSREIAAKSVTQLTVHCYWKGLPQNVGGFTQYYTGYGEPIKTESFKAELLLEDDSLTGKFVASKTLFNVTSETTQTLSPESVFQFPENTKFLKVPEERSTDFGNLSQSKLGFISIRLSCPAVAFGHKLFPRVMAEALTHNTRHRKKKVLPQEPYTPEIARVSIDYEAEEDVIPMPLKDLVQGDHFTCHWGPLGITAAEKVVGAPATELLPSWRFDGNLFIGLNFEASLLENLHSVNQHISIYFKLAPDGRMGLDADYHLSWRYYSDGGWKTLSPKSILNDGTHRLQRSGVISLTLPTDLAVHPSMAPSNLFWLTVATDHRLDQFARLEAIGCDGLEAESFQPVGELEKLSGGLSQWRFTNPGEANAQGIQKMESWNLDVSQPQKANLHDTKVRLNEQLRHKSRAVSPWDFERIVLAEFEQIDQVKCLPATIKGKKSAQPGHLQLIVIPKLQGDMKDQGMGLNSVELTEIQQRLQSVSANGVAIHVANASYEFVQVRAAVSFHEPMNSGEWLKRLNKDVSLFISPWSEIGQQTSLGWRLLTREVERFIAKLSYVDSVTQLSLVKVFETSENENIYQLKDTARRETDELAAEFPWTLPMPATHHEFFILDEQPSTGEPEPVGIDTLEIGNTFVIRGNHA